jgi:hypothetical protein
MSSQRDHSAITQIALAWMNRRTEVSARYNSNLIAETDRKRESVFQREFVEGHNEFTRQLVAELGIVDPTLFGALAELVANAPRMLQSADGLGGPN